MGRYDSNYYNADRYYDPTAGAAMAGTIRKEKKRREREYRVIQRNRSPKSINPALEFSRIFSEFYGRTFGPRTNGKSKRLSRYGVVRKNIQIYECCVRHVDDEDFSIGKVVRDLNLRTDRMVRQVFSGTGNMGKLIDCYNEWLATGEFCWMSSGKCYRYRGGQI